MTLDNFRTIIRAFVPAAKIAVIPNILLDVLINQAVADVNIRTAAYRGGAKFNVVAEQRNYSLSTVLPEFLAFANGGLWWNAGSASSPAWRKLDPLKRESLNSQFPQWMNEDSNSPLRYVHEGDNLQVDPMPNTSLDSGFWSFHVKKAVAMTDAAHYPFSGSSVEIAALKVLDDPIVDYVRWKLKHPLGDQQEGIISEKDYDKSVAEKAQLLYRRLDISSHPGARWRGPTIG